MADRLRLTPEAATLADNGEAGVHFYESSLADRDTGERLLTLVSVGRGMRLTVAQARELHDWLGEWLADDDPAFDTATLPGSPPTCSPAPFTVCKRVRGGTG